jgi:uncharacterized protein (DUF1330 family)
MTWEVIDTAGVPGQAVPRAPNNTDNGDVMTAYFIANIRQADIGPAIVDYLERIDATLEPFEGHFLVHGDEPEQVEGAWDGRLIVIAFPNQEAARGWYDSPAYREILPLRLDHTRGETILVQRVESDHRATDILTPN